MFVRARRRILHLIAADTVALVLYNVSTGAFNVLLVERYILHYNPLQQVGLHLSYNIAKYAGGFILGSLKRNLRGLCGITQDEMSVRGVVIDTAALACYQISLYIAFALISQVPLGKLSVAVCGHVLEHMLGGWWYTLISRWSVHTFANHTRTPREAATLQRAVSD